MNRLSTRVIGVRDTAESLGAHDATARLSDAQVEEWMERNHFRGNVKCARVAIDDAASLKPDSQHAAMG